jgi:hypothetical protein
MDASPQYNLDSRKAIRCSIQAKLPPTGSKGFGIPSAGRFFLVQVRCGRVGSIYEQKDS